MTILSILIPPVVEPLQAQIREHIVSRTTQKAGQMFVSVIANPVVVVRDITWKNPRRRLPTKL
jgi:hypothetical protein